MQLFDQEMLVLSGLVDAGGPAAGRLRQLVAQAIDTVLAMEHALPLALECYALAARDADVRRSIQAYYQRYHALLTMLLRQGFAGLIGQIRLVAQCDRMAWAVRLAGR